MLRKTLMQIVADYGIEVLEENKRTLALFSDYLPAGERELAQLKIAYDCNIITFALSTQRGEKAPLQAWSYMVERLTTIGMMDKTFAKALSKDILSAVGVACDFSEDDIVKAEVKEEAKEADIEKDYSDLLNELLDVEKSSTKPSPQLKKVPPASKNPAPERKKPATSNKPAKKTTPDATLAIICICSFFIVSRFLEGNPTYDIWYGVFFSALAVTFAIIGCVFQRSRVPLIISFIVESLVVGGAAHLYYIGVNVAIVSLMGLAFASMLLACSWNEGSKWWPRKPGVVAWLLVALNLLSAVALYYSWWSSLKLSLWFAVPAIVQSFIMHDMQYCRRSFDYLKLMFAASIIGIIGIYVLPFDYGIGGNVFISITIECVLLVFFIINKDARNDIIPFTSNDDGESTFLKCLNLVAASVIPFIIIYYALSSSVLSAVKALSISVLVVVAVFAFLLCADSPDNDYFKENVAVSGLFLIPSAAFAVVMFFDWYKVQWILGVGVGAYVLLATLYCCKGRKVKNFYIYSSVSYVAQMILIFICAVAMELVFHFLPGDYLILYSAFAAGAVPSSVILAHHAFSDDENLWGGISVGLVVGIIVIGIFHFVI